MITVAVRDALESTLINKSTAEPDKRTYSLHCKCVNDLSKYCVHLLGKEGLGPVRGDFPISNYVVYRAVIAVGVGYIIQQW